MMHRMINAISIGINSTGSGIIAAIPEDSLSLAKAGEALKSDVATNKIKEAKTNISEANAPPMLNFLFVFTFI